MQPDSVELPESNRGLATTEIVLRVEGPDGLPCEREMLDRLREAVAAVIAVDPEPFGPMSYSVTLTASQGEHVFRREVWEP